MITGKRPGSKPPL